MNKKKDDDDHYYGEVRIELSLTAAEKGYRAVY
jgi:hypothetical protein